MFESLVTGWVWFLFLFYGSVKSIAVMAIMSNWLKKNTKIQKFVPAGHLDWLDTPDGMVQIVHNDEVVYALAAIVPWQPAGVNYNTLDGGKFISVTTGFMEASPEVQAFVLNHEIGHVRFRHLEQCRKMGLNGTVVVRPEWEIQADRYAAEAVHRIFGPTNTRRILGEILSPLPWKMKKERMLDARKFRTQLKKS